MSRIPLTLAATAASIFLALAPCSAAPRPDDVVTYSQADAAAQDAAAVRGQIAAPDTVFPVGTRLRSLTISDGLAVADFNRALTARFPGGDSREVAIISALTRTLGHDPRIQRVQILQDGHGIDSIGGMIDLSQPLPVPHSTQYLHRSGHHRR